MSETAVSISNWPRRTVGAGASTRLGRAFSEIWRTCFIIIACTNELCRIAARDRIWANVLGYTAPAVNARTTGSVSDT